MASDIEYAIRRIKSIVAKSQASVKNDLALAIMMLPPKSQVQELKKVAGNMDKIYKAVMRLAVVRGVAETKKEKDRRIRAEAVPSFDS